MASGADQATLEFYAREAPVYTASGAGGVSRHLHGFLDRLPAGARILDLGCGGGRDSEAMLHRGFDAVPSDGVAEVARLAERRLDIPVRIMQFGELSDADAFDAVWAHASLLHVPRDALAGILSRVLTALRPGGLHFASFKAGGTEGRDGFGRYFNYLSPDQALTAYRRAGSSWRDLTCETYIGGGYEGGQGPWIAVTAQKSA